MTKEYMVPWSNEKSVSELMGKTLTQVVHVEDDSYDGECIYFHTTEGEIYKLYHHQNCCEDVYIKDICGNLSDLVGEPITLAEEIHGETGDDGCFSYTYTFYKFATRKGYVDISWYGSSNGYYSESVDFGLCAKGENDE